ncbi:MAG: hypothetical protein UW91_C0038G0001 [Parcubacteria group bacterium GW2011_GWF2_45_11]|nr:MAG: hypothetical protein UW91_C0038G0001 [Parcubacteria group bacterium GW2011_GWF2_45_11]
MSKEIANKTKEETYYKCIHCGVIAEMRFFGIPIKNSLTVNARKSGLMDARIMSGSVATRETIG